MSLTRLYSSIDVPDDSIQTPFEGFVDDYEEKFIGVWRECCEVTVLGV
jgi:hypothetical protein